MDRLRQWLEANGIPYQDDARLAEVTTFRLGGACPVMINCERPAQVVDVLHYFAEENHEFLLIGGGSNLVVADGGIDLPVIRFQSSNLDVQADGSTITVSAASGLDALAEYCADHSLAEMVTCSGIPGTVGGAVAGNAGAFGWQVGDCITSLTVCDRRGNVRTCTPGEMEFNYRDSRLKYSGEVLLDVTFELSADDADRLRARRQELLNLRKEKHPDLTVDCCAGSFFRNVAATSKAERRQAAGYFLEEAGAKEMRVGGAGVYPKHANIIVKRSESCTARDVYDLHLKMKQAVLDKFGFELIPEVRFIGKVNPS